MSKAILVIIIVVVVLVVVFLGVYLASNSRQNVAPADNQVKNENQFEIQGMKVEILTKGAGVQVKNDDNATVHYVGTLPDGTKFDSSVDRNAPFTFMVGKGRVIKGWDLGVAGMRVGEKRKLTIPSELAYGETGFLMIPAKATLIFEIELLKIN